MEPSCQNADVNAKYLLGQLNTARKEINNLRQQIKSLRYVHEKDVDNIKRLLGTRRNDTPVPEGRVISAEDIKPGTSSEDDALRLKPIGVISTWFPSKRCTPRQTGICGKVPGKLTLYNSVFTNPDHALEGLQDFSHMWILFHFHRNDSTHVRAKVAPPRLNGTRTGVFSTRSPHRPCPIGLSLVKITRIESRTIYFEGVDMVDQSPVLDIKPYIPQYDSPTHFDKLSNRSQESNANESTLDSVEESVNTTRDQVLSGYNDDAGSVDGFRAPSGNLYNRKGSAEISQEADTSRDAEIAMRLQAECYNNPRGCLSQLTDTNHPNNSDLILSRGPNAMLDILWDVRQSMFINAHNALQTDTDQETEALLTDTMNRLENMNTSNHQVGGSTESRNRDNQSSRNSRLLDGADGPNTVCGTDSGLIHHGRSLSSRIDNSPVRMGVREAPDGEEGLESQTLTPSQTLSNIQVSRTTSNSNLPDSNETNSSTPESRSNEARPPTDPTTTLSEVRVPDWIAGTRAPLCVVFNDRALIQLSEILGSKINDQKKAIENVLREDPRSVYLRQRWGSQFYTFLIHDLHITCRFDDSRGIVTVFQVRHAGRMCECGEPEWQCLGHTPIS